MTEVSSSYPQADKHKIESAMMNGVFLHAKYHADEVPKALFLQRVLEMLPRQSAETVISLYRHRFIEAIPPEHLDREIDWTIENAPTNSPAMRAYLADLLRAKGDSAGFELEYNGAMRTAQEENIHIEQ